MCFGKNNKINQKSFLIFFPWSSILNANSPISAYVNTENQVFNRILLW